MEKSHKLIIAPTNCGKSYLCNYLLSTNSLGDYDLIILVTDLAKEIKNDEVNNQYIESNNIVKKNVTNNLNNKTFMRIKEYCSSKNGRSVLIILDDLNKLIDTKNANNKKEMTKINQTKSNLNFIFSEGRHIGIYCIALVQYYKTLPPIIRNNSRYHIIVFGSNLIAETLYEYISHYFESRDELKEFIAKYNVDHCSIAFDTHNPSRIKKDNIILIKPSS